MKRSVWTILIALALAAPVIRADVKTRENTLTKFGAGGLMGSIMNRMAGAAAKDGITSTIAVKGSRMSKINDLTGEIIDLSEEKVYKLDMKKKEYTVATFAEIRAQMEKAMADAQKQVREAPEAKQAPPQKPATEMEYDFDVKETGQHKTLVGLETREVVMTVTAHEKGKAVEDSGGFILTTDEWLAARVPAMNEIGEFEMKYYTAVYSGAMPVIDPQQMAQLNAMYPALGQMSAKMQASGVKMDGTPLLTILTFDTVMGADQLKQAQQQPAPTSGGGGIGGMLARRMGPKPGPVQARSTMMTTTHEFQSIEKSASAEDVAIPAGFKEIKK